MENSASNHKIEEALHLLNLAAKEKKEELKKMIGDKYSHIHSAFSDMAAHAAENASETICKADAHVKKNPWPYIAGAAAGALFIGFLMGKKK